ncbi:MAG TPA: Mth938-like domain-containing protein [Balneolaceae bacterium]|nr:Mth938-like domain-containing protein [Balneolaceae bacterium]
MENKYLSPKINSISWGKVITEHGSEYKDAKLFPGGSRAWDWNETGTHHVPGIQPADVEELLEHGAKVIVLSKGFHERLQVCEETTQMLKNKGIKFYFLQTEKAKAKYNELSEDHAVGALIHSTC